MIKQYQQTLTDSIPHSLLPTPYQKLLFLDIETTGLSPESDSIYLIGCVYYKEKTWHQLQFFSEQKQDEADLLRSFFHFAMNYNYFIYYNGDHFDLPFLKKRAAKLSVPLSLPPFSIDLYKEIRPFQLFLKQKTLKQKDLEHFMGFQRKESYESRELIELYQNYLHTKEPHLLSLLLLHNSEDLKGMLAIVTLRSLSLLKQGRFQIQKTICQNFTLLSGEKQFFLSRLLPDIPIPVSICYESEICTITTLIDRSIQIKVPVFTGTLKYFYSNYKDYYYLPEEDYAIHKSIASYVDSAHRIKAKKSTSYTKKESCFLIQPEPLFTPEFKPDYNKKYSYFEVTEEFLTSPEQIKRYVTTLLSVALSKSN